MEAPTHSGFVSIVPWVFVLAGVLTPLSVSAQAPGNLGGIQEGDRVRVRTSDGQLLSGRYATSSLSSPSLEVAEGVAPVPLEGVDSVWVRRGSGKIGGIVGSVLGAGAGLGLGYFACELGSDGHGCQNAETVAAGTLIGAAVGLGLGSLVGSAFPRWRLQYARSGIVMRVWPTGRGFALRTSVPMLRSN
jgi:hypothetical protein